MFYSIDYSNKLVAYKASELGVTVNRKVFNSTFSNMSLLPIIFDDSDLWRASRLLDRTSSHFDDFSHPIAMPRSSVIQLQDYFKNLNAALQDTRSSVKYDKDKFQANFDVQHFKPEEISVKVNGDNEVTIEGKHEEKQDEHGHIYRHFVRKYTLPKNCDASKLDSKLSSDGVLSITAPRVGEQVEIRSVPIIQTGKPAKSIENTKTPENN